MPARAKYDTRRIIVRLDKEADEALQRLMQANGLTTSRMIRKLIMDAGKAHKSSKP